MNVSTFRARIKINGTELTDWSSFEVYKKLGEAEDTFNVELNRPITIAANSKITIEEGYGGSYVKLIDNKLIENAGNSAPQANLSGAGSFISRIAPIKTIYFVNSKWLKQRWPFYTLKNGLIHRYDPGNSNYKIHGISPSRLFIEELPGKNIRDTEFECVVEENITYSKIANYLCSKILDENNQQLYTLKLNAPDLTVQKTFVVNAGESYFQAIARLFSHFRPLIRVKNNVIEILDVGGTNQNRPTGMGAIKLSEDSFSTYKVTKIINKDIIDYVLIIGPTKNFTYKYYKPLTKSQLKGKKLNGQEVVINSEEVHTIEGSANYYEMTKPDNDTVKKITKKSTMVIDPTNEDMAITKEETIVYGPNSQINHKTTTEFEWADFHTPTGSITEEYNRMPDLNVGMDPVYTTDDNGVKVVWYPPPTYSLQLQSRITIIHKTIIEELGLMETDKYIEKMIVYNQDKVRKDGEDYFLKSSPFPVNDSLRMGQPIYEKSTDADTGWKSTFELAEHESIRIETLAPYLLRKNIIQTKYHPITSTVFKSEDIPLKKKKAADQTELRWLFIRFNDGAIIHFDENQAIPIGTTIHPRVDINAPDVTDSIMAERIARAIMASKPSSNTQGNVRTTCSIPGLEIGQSVIMPDGNVEYFDWDAEQFVDGTIEGMTYWLTGLKKAVKFTGSWESNVRTFDQFDELELREKF